MWSSLNKLKESTRSSFSRVKEHNLMLENAIKEDRKLLIEQNRVILQLKREIELLMNEFNDFKAYLNDYKSSSGNEGVINNHQQSSTTIINSQQSSTVNSNQQLNNEILGQKGHLEPEFSDSTIINNDQQSLMHKGEVINSNQQSSTIINVQEAPVGKEQDLKRPISDIKRDLEVKFRGLTDREFSVFMAVYQLEEQLPDVNYSDVSKLLNISEMTVRGYVNSLLIKKIPLEKRRMYNKKVFLAISHEFRELNLASFLLTLRLPNTHFIPQKTLKNF